MSRYSSHRGVCINRMEIVNQSYPLTVLVSSSAGTFKLVAAEAGHMRIDTVRDVVEAIVEAAEGRQVHGLESFAQAS